MGRVTRNDGKRMCYKCKTEKELKLCFHKDSSFALGYSKVCKECYKKSNKRINRTKKVKTDIEACMSKRCASIKHRAKTNNLPFDLSSEYLLELYSLQHGKCYYTEREMKIDNNKDTRIDSMSIDRLTPSMGYIKGNVVLCCGDINSMKNDRTEKEFKTYLLERISSLQNYLTRN